MTREARPKDEMSSGESILGRWNRNCKVQKAGKDMEQRRNRKEASGAREGGGDERGVEVGGILLPKRPPGCFLTFLKVSSLL